MPSARLTVVVILTLAPELFSRDIDFNRDVRPILSSRCLTCHGPDKAKREAGLRLDDPESALHSLESGTIAIQPGQPEKSEMIRRITNPDETLRMPPPEFGKPLTASETQILKQWISEGAPFAKHWSYVPPVRPDVPNLTADLASFARNPIDNFVLQKLHDLKLKPSPTADNRALVRRVFLDLVGLPPAADEGLSWVKRLDNAGSDRDTVWQELVESLLNRPEYGEHWARKWLDLARYADSSGYADDPARTIWPWRDWVIRAFNSNLAFDDFTVEQLAGDLLPNAQEDQLIATAFHRNTMTNNEGGTQDEEFRNVAIVDRVNTTMAVWMGTTMACAQCHSHKYDPISQEEYFQVFAILNNTEDADRGDDSPRLPLFTAVQKARRSELETRISELNRIFETPSESLAASQSAWENQMKQPPRWAILQPSSLTRLSGSASQISDSGEIVIPTAAAKDTYTLEFRLDPSPNPLTAVQLETLPDANLPGGGSGHGGGNFVISELKAQILPASQSIPSARFLRLEIPGEQKILSLAEVEVFSGTVNIAKTGQATQSSTDFDGPAALAIDGNTDGRYENKSVTHTAISDNPWWELDLRKQASIEQITVWNRAGEGLHQRLAGCRMTLLNDSREVVWSQTIDDPPKTSASFTPSGSSDVRWVAAGATFQQDGFAAEEVFDGKTEPENGWAIGGRVTERQSLTLIPDQPISVKVASTLRITVEQNSPYAQHILGKFRFSATPDDGVLERSRLPRELESILTMSSENRSEADQSLLAAWFRNEVAPELTTARLERRKLQTELQTMKPETSVPILRELTADKRRKTYFQFRGNYLDKGHEVHEAVPAAFPPIPTADGVNRLTFARWVVSPENPLTPRVIVNRYWENLFGRGIVLTSEEFGSQGELPTHPELLDWLAREFVDSGWNMKTLLKTIATSSVYQQSSFVSAEAAAADPDNRWLARGPRVRLSAEMVRDQALMVSGLLSHRMYGPPVKPPQPSLGLSAAFGSSTDWQTSEGEDRYRRAIYTTWRRSNPYPSMATFDAPNREVCTLRRNRTNTPLQAMVTMNDPVYVESAQALGRLMLQHDPDHRRQIRWGFERCLLRIPKDSELESLQVLFEDLRKSFSDSPEDAMKLATDPLGALPPALEPADAAAMTVVASVLLNLDEMIMKR